MSLLKQALYNSMKESDMSKNKNSKNRLNDLIEMEEDIKGKIKSKQYGIKKFDQKSGNYLKFHEKDFLAGLRRKEINEIENLINKTHKINSLQHMLEEKIDVDDISDALSHLKIAFGSRNMSKRKTSKRNMSKRKMSKMKMNKSLRKMNKRQKSRF